MALDPKFAGQVYSADVSPKAIHTLELCQYTYLSIPTLLPSLPY